MFTTQARGAPPMSQVTEDTRSFRGFYRREAPRVLALAIAMTGDRSEAEDVVQEAFTRALRDWHRIGEYDDPGAWVRKVAVNQIRSRFRKLGSGRRAVARLAGMREAAPDPVDLTAPDDEFWAAVRALPRNQALAVTLKYVEDRSVAEIADLLGVAEGTVKSHLFRARRTLSQTLGLQDGDVR
jgi:RNA polymerase sigma-70 factor (ECF subfamily)